jgi:3-hydroxy-3-methylglutaryl CoA synthase
MKRATIGPDDLGAVFAASVSDFFAEHGIAGQVASRLGAFGDLRTGDFQATVRASGDAIATAYQYVRSTGESVLVVAADIMPIEKGSDDEAEMGASAGAILLHPDATSSLATLESIGQATTGFIERHRLHDEPATQGDSRFECRYGVKPAVTKAIENASGVSSDYSVISAPGARLVNAASELIPGEQVSTYSDVGYSGTTMLLLDLASALESASPGDSISAVVYGQGGADVFELSVSQSMDDPAGLTVEEQIKSKEYVSYAKNLEYREKVDYKGVITQ